jgi:hypothetical protein
MESANGIAQGGSVNTSFEESFCKKQYHSPKLTSFGKIKDLTESGSNGGSESSSGTMCETTKKVHAGDCGFP